MRPGKTKFILHGGFDPEKKDEDLSSFYREIFRDVPQQAKVLIVPFAKDPDRIAPSVARVRDGLDAAKDGREVAYEIAEEEAFIDQLKSADIVYFQGGSSVKLLDALKKYADLEGVLFGKVVAGESGGANVWCEYFYSPRADKVCKGLGVLSYKIIPHYKKEYEGKLRDVGAGLKEIQLPEYEFQVFYK